MKIKKTIFLFIGLVCFLFGNAQKNQDDITGIWLTGGKEPAKIQIYKATDNKFYGKIIWLKNPVEKDGTPRVDANNPDKTKRKNPVNGLQILKGFKFDGDDEWKGGDIYDPESGKTYSSYITLKDKNTLKVRGYVGISLFGRTEIWTRVQ
jgi:uncharacterized protein (DUF2147 family)